MVLSYMSRKCIYTGLVADAKDSLIPKISLDEEERHNWANKVPVSSRYKNFKQYRTPTDLEVEANEIFYLIELTKLRLAHLQEKQKQIQAKLLQHLPPPEELEQASKKKAKQIEQAEHEVDVIKPAEQGLEKILKEYSKNIWD